VHLELDQTVWLKKPHACGSYEWTVVRLGADIGLKCAKCGRRVLIERAAVERRARKTPPKGLPRR